MNFRDCERTVWPWRMGFVLRGDLLLLPRLSGPSPGQSSDSTLGPDFTSVRCRCRCGVVLAEPICTQQSTDTFVEFTDKVPADVPNTEVGKLRDTSWNCELWTG